MSGPLIYLVAGEASGDALGGRLMAALKERTGGAIEFAGVGGETMMEQGLTSLFPMPELSVMGLLEVVPRIPNVLRRLSQTQADILERRPAAVITIDSPGFTYRLAQRLQGAGIPLIHYVAPSVWAWRPKRAEKTAALFDHLLTLFPFEPPYFTPHGLDATFVGHPALETPPIVADGSAFRAAQGIGEEVPVLCILPGSRAMEVNRLMPLFRRTAKRMAELVPDMRIVIPTVGAVSDLVYSGLGDWPGQPIVVSGEVHRAGAFAASTVALAASGTVTLELAKAGVPMVVAYRVNPLTAMIARRLVKIRFVSLINIVLKLPAIPEFLQGDCRPETLAGALRGLMSDPAARKAQLDLSARAIAAMRPPGLKPSQAAAEAVLKVIGVPAVSEKAPSTD